MVDSNVIVAGVGVVGVVIGSVLTHVGAPVAQGVSERLKRNRDLREQAYLDALSLADGSTQLLAYSYTRLDDEDMPPPAGDSPTSATDVGSRLLLYGGPKVHTAWKELIAGHTLLRWDVEVHRTRAGIGPAPSSDVESATPAPEVFIPATRFEDYDVGASQTKLESALADFVDAIRVDAGVKRRQG